MILLRLITWPYVRKHVLRTLVTTAGIALGVAVFVGMNSANESVMAVVESAPCSPPHKAANSAIPDWAMMI